jgi:hypothetical protein
VEVRADVPDAGRRRERATERALGGEMQHPEAFTGKERSSFMEIEPQRAVRA